MTLSSGKNKGRRKLTHFDLRADLRKCSEFQEVVEPVMVSNMRDVSNHQGQEKQILIFKGQRKEFDKDFKWWAKKNFF